MNQHEFTSDSEDSEDSEDNEVTFGKTGFNVCFKEDEHVHETNVTRNPPSFTAEIWMITLQDLIPDSCNFPLANLQNKGMYNRSDTPGTES